MALINKKLTDLAEKATASNDAFIHIAEPSDLTQSPSGSSYKIKKSNLGYALSSSLDLKEDKVNKNTANGYAGLGADGKLMSSQLPSITVTDTFVVASQVAMLAIVGQTGDVAVRTDLNKSYILNGTNPAILADWQELLTPTDAVQSFNGRAGTILPSAGDYTADQITETATRVFQTPTQRTNNDATSSIQTQLNGKAPSTGSANYIQNGTAQQTANLNISGSGVFGSSVTAAFLSLNAVSYIDLGTSWNTGVFSIKNSGVDFFKLDVPNNRVTNNLGKYLTSSNSVGQFGAFDNFGTAIVTNNIERLRVTETGNVGIGTTTPTAKLDVNGTLNATGAANFYSSVTATSFNGGASLTGIPTAPTATLGTNTTQIATTAFVQNINSNTLKTTGYQSITSGGLSVGGISDYASIGNTGFSVYRGGVLSSSFGFAGASNSFVIGTPATNISGRDGGFDLTATTPIYSPPPVQQGHLANKEYVDKNRLKTYTVATLPAGTQGDTAYVTDALSPTYLATITGGGAVVCPVFYNGTNWVSH